MTKTGSKDFKEFKSEMDSWVKDFNGQLDEFTHVPKIIEEHHDNIDHNYELLQQMRSEIRNLKEEVSALRLVQMLQLKSAIQSK